MIPQEILERAIKFAVSTTTTRCALMGAKECLDCSRKDRGECDFRSRVEGFLKGAKYILENFH